MPAVSVQIDPDTLGMIGEYTAAAQGVERELKKVQREILKGAAAGRPTDRAMAAQAVALMDKNEKFKSLAKDQKSNEEATRKGFLGGLAKLLNTHNPHGAIRNVLHGNVSAGMIEHVGEMLKEKGLARINAGKFGGVFMAKQGASIARLGAGPILFLVAKAAKAAFDTMEQKGEIINEAERTQLAVRSASFEHIKRLRYATGGLDAMKALSTKISHDTGDTGGGLMRESLARVFRDGFHAPQMRALEAAHEQRTREFYHTTPFLTKRGKDVASSTVINQKDWAVEREFTFEKRGLLGRVADFLRLNTYSTPWSKSHDEHMREVVLERTKNVQNTVKKTAQDAMKLWAEQPDNATMTLERSNVIHAIRSFEIERSLQWNQY